MIFVCFPFQIFNEHELLQAKLDTLSKTNMVDYLIDVKQHLYPDINVLEVNVKYLLDSFENPLGLIIMFNNFIVKEMTDRRQEILVELARLQENAKIVLDLINEEKIMKKMESMRDSKALIKFLAEEADVSFFSIFNEICKIFVFNSLFPIFFNFFSFE